MSLLPLLPFGARKNNAQKSTLVLSGPVPDLTGDNTQGLPADEVARLERLFKDRLVNGILYQARLEWQDFDIEAFLKLIEMSDLETVCRKDFSVDTKSSFGPAEVRGIEQRKKKRDRERKKAYERLMCEMRLLTEVLKVLDAPAEDIKIPGLIGVIKDARRNPSFKFDNRVYKRKPEEAVRYTYPAILRENRDLVFADAGTLSLVAKRPTNVVAGAAASKKGTGDSLSVNLDTPDSEIESEIFGRNDPQDRGDLLPLEKGLDASMRFAQMETVSDAYETAETELDEHQDSGITKIRLIGDKQL